MLKQGLKKVVHLPIFYGNFNKDVFPLSLELCRFESSANLYSNLDTVSTLTSTTKKLFSLRSYCLYLSDCSVEYKLRPRGRGNFVSCGLLFIKWRKREIIKLENEDNRKQLYLVVLRFMCSHMQILREMHSLAFKIRPKKQLAPCQKRDSKCSHTLEYSGRLVTRVYFTHPHTHRRVLLSTFNPFLGSY